MWNTFYSSTAKQYLSYLMHVLTKKLLWSAVNPNLGLVVSIKHNLLFTKMVDKFIPAHPAC